MYNFNKAKFSKMRSITELTVLCPELAHIATDFNPIWVRAILMSLRGYTSRDIIRIREPAFGRDHYYDDVTISCAVLTISVKQESLAKTHLQHQAASLEAGQWLDFSGKTRVYILF
jgi:hypothetical protein